MYCWLDTGSEDGESKVWRIWRVLKEKKNFRCAGYQGVEEVGEYASFHSEFLS